MKPGYGRNYLIPQGFAVVANRVNKKIALENIRQAAHKIAKYRKEAEDLAMKLSQLTVELKVNVGDNGKIFGSITSMHLADALRDQHIEVDRKNISLKKAVKEVGVHEATIRLYQDVIHTLSFNVLPAT